MPSNISSANPEIERLTREMNQAREASERWDTLNIGALILAGIVAGAIALFGVKISSWNRRVLQTTDELNRAKDRQLALDLKLKDDAIAEAKKSAAGAIVDAAKAEVRVGEANQKAGEAALEAARISHENLSLQSAIEAERTTRLELEKSLAPRQVPDVKADIRNTEEWDQAINELRAKGDALKKSAGIHAIIAVVPDFEARRAARTIEQLLQEAGWNVAPLRIVDDESFRDGVTIWKHLSSDLEGAVSLEPTPAKADELKSEMAAESLSDLLKYWGWEAEIESGSRGNSPFRVPPNTVRIQVGLRPSPYFDPEWVKKIRKTADEVKKKSKTE